MKYLVCCIALTSCSKDIIARTEVPKYYKTEVMNMHICTSSFGKDSMQILFSFDLNKIIK